MGEWLRRQGYTVYGLTRSLTLVAGEPSAEQAAPAGSRVEVFGDLSDSARLLELIGQLRPDEVYHFGAQSDDQISFEAPEYTANITGLSTVRLLEAIRQLSPAIKFFQASSAQIFRPAPPPQHEDSPMTSHSPYDAAKLYATHLTRVYRATYGLFCCNAFLFNHESARRPERYVTRKITRGLARILAGQQETLVLGNLQARRDWGYAPEYIEVIWRQLQQSVPEDLVIGSGMDHSIGEFVETACGYVGLRPERHVKTDARYVRDTEPWIMRADISKAGRMLGWAPTVGFEDLVKVMLDADMQAFGLDVIGDGLAAVRKAGLGWSIAGFPEPSTLPAGDQGVAS